MKKKFFLSAIALLFAVGYAIGQDIPQSKVPSLVVNQFQQNFSKARDIEWEMKGENYEVEFEVGRHPDRDHEILYSPAGQVLRHKQEISSKDLPAQISQKLKAEYDGYRIKDVKKIVEGDKTIYKLEAKSHKEEWELKLDEKGNILRKKRD